ncbi:hypothetical protein GCM10009753_50550 [Streptantibioticus ferralitis]
MIVAAATPWTTRPAISTPTPGANAQIADPMVNTATPVRKARRRPYRSLSDPQERTNADRHRV